MITQKEFVDEIAAKACCSKVDARRSLDLVVGQIKSFLRAGHGVKIAGFGCFRPVVRNARLGRNPRTGKPIHIERGTAIRFKAFKGILLK